jgi:hypothetical protein
MLYILCMRGQELDYVIAYVHCPIFQLHTLKCVFFLLFSRYILILLGQIMSTIQKHIWAEVAKLDSNIVDIILDELVRTATDGGIGTRRCETISHIVAALSSINVRGRIYSKLRKVCHMHSIVET